MSGWEQFLLGGIVICIVAIGIGIIFCIIYGTYDIARGKETDDGFPEVIAIGFWFFLVSAILIFIVGKISYWIGTALHLIHIPQ